MLERFAKQSAFSRPNAGTKYKSGLQMDSGSAVGLAGKADGAIGTRMTGIAMLDPPASQGVHDSFSYVMC